MFFNSVDIGIDLGTANLLVYIKGKGIVFNEPSVVAINRSKNKILAVGNEARDMIGKVPESISVIRPLKEGVIANYTVTQKMLEFVVERVAGKSFFSKGVKLGFGQNLCQRCNTFNGCATGDKVVRPLAPISLFVVGDAIFNLLFFVLELRELAFIFRFLCFQFGDGFLFCHSV